MKILFLIVLCVPLYAGAQYVPVSKPLYDTIAHMDSVVFNAANAQDLKTMRSLFTEDLEFYHDGSGLAGYEETMKNFQNLRIIKTPGGYWYPAVWRYILLKIMGL